MAVSASLCCWAAKRILRPGKRYGTGRRGKRVNLCQSQSQCLLRRHGISRRGSTGIITDCLGFGNAKDEESFLTCDNTKNPAIIPALTDEYMLVSWSILWCRNEPGNAFLCIWKSLLMCRQGTQIWKGSLLHFWEFGNCGNIRSLNDIGSAHGQCR